MITALAVLVWLTILGLLMVFGGAGCALVLAWRDRREGGRLAERAARPRPVNPAAEAQDAAAVTLARINREQRRG